MREPRAAARSRAHASRHALSAAAPLVPALRFHALTGPYDPLVSFLVDEATHRRRTLSRRRPKLEKRVLGLVCGTGSLALRLKRSSRASAPLRLRRL